VTAWPPGQRPLFIIGSLPALHHFGGSRLKRIGLQLTGTPGKARLAVERTRAFRRLRNWRVGIEARISHLKRSFGQRRTRLRRLGGARTWVGLGIIAYNLQRMTTVAG
jgi:IS5 family transposase